MFARCVLLIAALAASACAKYEVGFAELPARPVEGRAMGVSVRYEATTPATLHCQLKNEANVVLEEGVATVEGAGRQEFTLHLPARSELPRLLIAIWMGEDWRTPLSSIVHSPPIRVISARQAALVAEQEASVEATLAQLGWQKSPQGNVAILDARLPGSDPTLLVRYTDAFRARGHLVTLLSPEQFASAALVTPARFDLVVLLQTSDFPAECVETVRSYSEAGGNLAVLGGPAFERLLWPTGEGGWVDRDSQRQVLLGSVAEGARGFLDFSGGAGEWQRSSNNPQADSSASTEQGANPCLRLDIRALNGWDTFGTQLAASPFAEGQTLTTFRARGDARTSQLSIEWRERDGSRWIGVVPLTQEWGFYALRPEDFLHWQDGTTRGTPGDRFRPAEAVELVLGLASTHTHGVGPGDHTIWLDNFGAASLPAEISEELGLLDEVEVPVLEGVSPAYKTYPVTGAIEVQPDPRQALWTGPTMLAPADLVAIHPRPQGTGIGKDRRWRWIPLLRAIRGDGRVAGFPAAMVLDAGGGARLSIPTANPSFLGDPSVLDAVVTAAGRLIGSVLLEEGGAQYYAYRPGESVKLGATVRNRSGADVERELRITLRAAGREEPIVESHPRLVVAAGQSGTVALEGPLAEWPEGEMTVRTELLEAGAVVDVLEHPLNVWRPSESPRFVTAREGDLWLDGRKWYVHGVNYMPSSGIGIEDGNYFEAWLGARPYDPDVIEWDLAECERIGLNTISVFIYYDSREARNLWDLIERCTRHGIMVNLSLRPGTPMDFRWDEMRTLIEVHDLARCDTVFAYDLAWEPFFGTYPERSGWDADWAKWIEARYGSVSNAEADWGFACPRRPDGSLTGPSDEQVDSNGAWTRMSVAYRDFVDDLVGSKYAEARRLVRTVDPNHLVSFRMTVAGDPTCGQRQMPYDLKGLANAVDLMAPEGYGRIGGWEQVKPGWFTDAYSRAVAPGLPVVWAEYGWSVWDRARMAPNPDALAFEGRFYRDYLEMVLRSGANGAICWWFPGGFRVNENSDFGIINPDRSWRPCTEALHAYAPRILAERERPTADEIIEISREGHADGIKGIYAEVAERFWQAISEGRTPGLRWRD